MFSVGIADNEYEVFLEMRRMALGIGQIGQCLVTPSGGGLRGRFPNWRLRLNSAIEISRFVCVAATPAAHSSRWEVYTSRSGDFVTPGQYESQFDADSGAVYNRVDVDTSLQTYMDFDPAHPWQVGDVVELRHVDFSSATPSAALLNSVAAKTGTKTEIVSLTCTKEGGGYGAGTATQVVTLSLGVWVNIVNWRNISGVSVTSHSLVNGVDYDLDLVEGKIRQLSTGVVASGTAVTLQFNKPASAQPAEFTVTGSVTGAMGTYIQNANFSSSQLDFSLGIVDGNPSNQFKEADVVRIYTTENALKAANQNWTELRNDTSSFVYHGGGTVTQTAQCVWKGTGLTGSDEILIGFDRKVTTNVGSAWKVQGLKSHNGALAFDSQDGILTNAPGTSFWSGVVPYWISMTGRVINWGVINGLGSVDYSMTGYAGLALAAYEPEFYPLPLVIGGNTNVNNSTYDLWSTINTANSNFWHYRGADDTTKFTNAILDPLGNWHYVSCEVNGDVGEGALPYGYWGYNTSSANARYHNYPYGGSGSMAQTMYLLDGSYLPIPIEWYTPWNTQVGCLGVTLDGVYAIPGINSASPGTKLPLGSLVVTSDNRKMVVLKNVYRSDNSDYVAMELR